MKAIYWFSILVTIIPFLLTTYTVTHYGDDFGRLSTAFKDKFIEKQFWCVSAQFGWSAPTKLTIGPLFFSGASSVCGVACVMLGEKKIGEVYSEATFSLQSQSLY